LTLIRLDRDGGLHIRIHVSTLTYYIIIHTITIANLIIVSYFSPFSFPFAFLQIVFFFLLFFFFSSRRRHTRSVSAFLLNRSSDLLPHLLTLWVCKLLMLICILTKNVITSCSVTMMLFLHLEVKPLMTLTTVLYLSCA